MMYLGFGLFLPLVFLLLTESDAAWSDWSTWTTCTATCGTGVITRARTCDDNIASCVGQDSAMATCNTQPCTDGPQAYTWSIWGDWSVCSQTCGGGTRTRTRTCTGADHVTQCCDNTDTDSCTREHTQSRDCENDDCIGDWADWRPWGGCSMTCGEGSHTRQRDCQPEGSVCYGIGQQTRSCYIQCLTQDKIIKDMDDRKSCLPDNPCHNSGLCASNGDHVTCVCRGDWRGRDCNSLCLQEDDTSACLQKHGIFHMCSDCSKFIVCARGGLPISMTCTDGRIWTGDGCRLINETNVICIQRFT